MAANESQFTTLAGEHYVAHRLAMLGFVPAIVRQGIRSMDLLVASQDGARTVAVQVESAASALRDSGEGDAARTLQFPLSQRSLDQAADTTIFCFVDLQARRPASGPDVYVVTARQLRGESGISRLRKYSYLRYIRPLSLFAPFRNNWQPFYDALQGSDGVDLPSTEPEAHVADWNIVGMRNQSA